MCLRSKAVGAERRGQDDAKVADVLLVHRVEFHLQHHVVRAALQIREDALDRRDTVRGTAQHHRASQGCQADLPDVKDLLRNAHVILKLICRNAGQVERLLHHAVVALAVFRGVLRKDQCVFVEGCREGAAHG